MYADEAVLFVHAQKKQEVAEKLIDARSGISEWLTVFSLHLNTCKTDSKTLSLVNLM